MCNVIEMETKGGALQTPFITVYSSAVRFKVKASRDAIVALANGECEKSQRIPMTEIRIGASDNTKSIIYRHYEDNRILEKCSETIGILDRNEYVGFWIRWYDRCILVGVQGSSSPFLTYNDPFVNLIDSIGVRTAGGSTGFWKIEVSPVIFWSPVPKPIEEKLRWVPMCGVDNVPPDAVIGGFVGEVLYVARMWMDNAWFPGIYMPSMKCAYTCYRDLEYQYKNFEILCGYNFMWIQASYNPPDVFPVSENADDGQHVYIGRALMTNCLIPGNFLPDSPCCTVSWNSVKRMVGKHLFEVLISPNRMILGG